VADKIVSAKQPDKPKAVQKAKTPEKDKDKPKQENAFQRWFRETMGELRKVSWPTVPEARRLTEVVLIVMLAMSILLGSLDIAFSKLLGLVVR
jgi:preprotein translocase subunit SecE